MIMLFPPQGTTPGHRVRDHPPGIQLNRGELRVSELFADDRWYGPRYVESIDDTVDVCQSPEIVETVLCHIGPDQHR
jgi:hypothetical protein